MRSPAREPRVRPMKTRTARRRQSCATPRRFSRITFTRYKFIESSNKNIHTHLFRKMLNSQNQIHIFHLQQRPLPLPAIQISLVIQCMCAGLEYSSDKITLYSRRLQITHNALQPAYIFHQALHHVPYSQVLLFDVSHVECLVHLNLGKAV